MKGTDLQFITEVDNFFDMTKEWRIDFYFEKNCGPSSSLILNLWMPCIFFLNLTVLQVNEQSLSVRR